MPLLSEKLAEAEAILRANSVTDSRREASSLVAIALDRDKAFLIAHPDYELQPSECKIVDAFVLRRASHEPFQYISGIQEFYGLDFEVTPDVLIPRPETEMLVERSIEILGHRSAKRFCEVGIGSGCIAVSILRHVAGSSAVGLDVSHEALVIARRNADKHDVGDRLRLSESDLFSALADEKFDLILSNPPYVPDGDIARLQPEVRDFEPRLALMGGPDGLSVIRGIATHAPRFLRPGGVLSMEIGFDQSEKVVEMFDLSRWRSPELFPDLQGIPRLLFCELI